MIKISRDLMDENRLREDQKQFRKLRKLLRQIEHLELVTRKLNEEEEQKVARRDEYRLRLIELTSSYKGDELMRLIDENSTTTNIGGNQEESYQDQDVVEASTDDLNELVEEFEKMGHKSEPEPEPELSEVVNTAPTITKEEKKEEKKVEVETKIPSEKKKKKKPTVVTFDTFTNPSVHVDLITTVDIYSDLGLIVTGSRDTTLKVWKFSEADESCEPTQTLSGHRDSVTYVRFLPSSTFQEALSRLDQSNNDDELLFDQLSKWRTRLVGDDNDDEISSSDKSIPLVISSSLDNSFRLWSIAPISFCLKEFYLYNPVNHFDLRGTQLVFAMDAGKISLWNDFKQSHVSRAFPDSDRVVCVKFKDSEFYSMSQNGLLKIFKIDEENRFKLNKEIDIFERLNISIRKNFKMFELTRNDEIAVLNDNQPFIILFDVLTDNFRLISANSSRYGLTTSIYKSGSQLFMGSYSVDDGQSSLNVFEISDESLEYKHTLINEASSSTNSISTLCGYLSQMSSIVVSCSSVNFTLWFIENGTKRRKVKAQMKRICEVKIEEDESDISEDEENLSKEDNLSKDDNGEEDETEKKTNRCNLQ